MKILVSAYACETGRGSEGEIGWRLVLRLAQVHDVWVITRANLREVHERAFAGIPRSERLHFVYFDLPWIFRFYKKGARFFLAYYYLWQIGVCFKARRLARAHKFDVTHHLIGGMDWMPSGVALVPGRFVWGPVGSENTHPVMRKYLSPMARLKDYFRLMVRWCMRHLDPFVRITGARASVILTHTIETMPLRYVGKLRAFTQTGIENSPALAKPKADFGRSSSLKIIYAGELKDWKGSALALGAALKFFEGEPKAELVVVGDGPLRKEMEAAARNHLHGGRVRFLGRVSMAELVDELNQSDVFIYPSFHHGLATVVLQAMLTGLPIVCVEGDATSRAVGARAGITVPLQEGADPVGALAAALHFLNKNESERLRLAIAAREIALVEYSYDRLAEKLGAVLEEVAGVARPEIIG